MKTFSIVRIVWDWPPPWIGLSPGPYDLTVAQQALGNRMTVFSGGWPFNHKENISDVKLYRAVSGIIPRLNMSIFFSTAPHVLVMYFLRKIFSRVDIIHAHGHLSLFFSLYKKLFGWLDRTKYVVHLHHVSVARYKRIQEEFDNHVPILTRFEWFLQQFTERIALDTADKVIVVSESMREEIKTHYEDRYKNVAVLVNGVNTSLFSPVGKKASLGISCEKPIVFVGNLNQRKNPDVLIQALKHLPNEYGVVFIGPDHMSGKLQESVQSLNLQSRVVFLGEVHNRNLSSYLRAARVLCLPSSSEGFPKVVLESLACGVPVAVSGFSVEANLAKFVAYIKEINPVEIAHAIETAEALRGEGMVQEIRETYSWEKRAIEMQTIYESLF